MILTGQKIKPEQLRQRDFEHLPDKGNMQVWKRGKIEVYVQNGTSVITAIFNEKISVKRCAITAE
jgi:hypothetical protein